MAVVDQPADHFVAGLVDSVVVHSAVGQTAVAGLVVAADQASVGHSASVVLAAVD